MHLMKWVRMPAGLLVLKFNDRCEAKGNIKVGLSPSKKMCIICLIESHLKMMKNAFYFILKALSFSRYLSFCPGFLVM